MEENASLPVVRELMTDFAEGTGLAPAGKSPRRYLWTDAFAVCNFLELFRRTGDAECGDLALRLVEQVHGTLGRHRGDDGRSGWISGLDEEEGRRHPTRGGLRIGKSLKERRPGDPFDERLEWDRDGQYYHYLTKWMDALDSLSRSTGEAKYNGWALELAKAAHAAFTVPLPSGAKRMYWKMSIDLARPLVSSMGQHDPLDGLVTYSQLQATAKGKFGQPHSAGLHLEIGEMAEICRDRSWATADPLGIGGLLADAGRMTQLMERGAWVDVGLLETVLDCALLGLESMALEDLPADYRLAFRELGLSIGLKAIGRMRILIEENPDLFGPLTGKVEPLFKYAPIGEKIEGFWLQEENREASSWAEHRDINTVMLATSLTPDGFLGI